MPEWETLEARFDEHIVNRKLLCAAGTALCLNSPCCYRGALNNLINIFRHYEGEPIRMLK